jgi:hypothetical protein
MTDEGRAVRAAAAATALAAVGIAVSALIARDSGQATAADAVVVSIAALAVACAGLAGYTIWLRQAVSARMATLLRPYLVAPAVADGIAVRPVLRGDSVPITAELRLLASAMEH